MARYHYRCSKPGCRQRVTLRKKIEYYVKKRFKLCPACGRDTLKPCPSVKAQIKRDTCNCDGLHFLHKKGSKGCRFESKVKIMNRELDVETLPRTKEPLF